MKDDLHISQLSGPRFQLALELLREGRPFIYSAVTFCFTSNDELECAAHTSWGFDSPTEETARNDLVRAKTLVHQMLDKIPDFAELIGNRKIRFCLIVDYSTGIGTLCRLDGDDIQWAAGIQPR
jgi:hypothetical protein